MPDQDTGQTMSKKYELLTARYRSAAPLLQAAKPSMASHMLAQVLDTSCGSVLEPLRCHAACIRTITSNLQESQALSHRMPCCACICWVAGMECDSRLKCLPEQSCQHRCHARAWKLPLFVRIPIQPSKHSRSARLYPQTMCNAHHCAHAWVG